MFTAILSHGIFLDRLARRFGVSLEPPTTTGSPMADRMLESAERSLADTLTFMDQQAASRIRLLQDYQRDRSSI